MQKVTSKYPPHLTMTHHHAVLHNLNMLRKRVDPLQLEKSLNQQPHFLILILGLVTGSTIAMAIGYGLKAHFALSLFLIIIPIALCYLLRKVYIYTVLHFQE
ncbi:hypothetical protein [uncultured Acinetobacter sp.]|uniref:hypothetical protein n=1 Tax=uncultured Acinetobacter sp. TaxID=165433 RepID=UPI0025CDA1E3|nr:hypothetical protein [uncultured Acinetobacter sp.]